MLSFRPRSCRRFGTFGALVSRFRGRRFNGRRFHGGGLPDRRCRGKCIEFAPGRSSLAGRSGACCRDLRLVLRSRGFCRSPRRRSWVAGRRRRWPHRVESRAGPRRSIRLRARVHAGRPRIASNLEGSRRRRRLRGWNRSRPGWSGEPIWVRRIGFRQWRRAWLMRRGCTSRTFGRWPTAREIRLGRWRAASGI